ncbi:hypothetical protein BDR26DRAFT_263943 [Obelidium mucronatum]|nr:hypothetical protein BDR26DRAFT_263943 [Obelidium mucronatum]
MFTIVHVSEKSIGHWFPVLYDPDLYTLYTANSAPLFAPAQVDLALDFLQKVFQDFSLNPTKPAIKELESRRQTNGSDCGFIALSHLRAILKDRQGWVVNSNEARTRELSSDQMRLQELTYLLSQKSILDPEGGRVASVRYFRDLYMKAETK